MQKARKAVLSIGAHPDEVALGLDSADRGLGQLGDHRVRGDALVSFVGARLFAQPSETAVGVDRPDMPASAAHVEVVAGLLEVLPSVAFLESGQPRRQFGGLLDRREIACASRLIGARDRREPAIGQGDDVALHLAVEERRKE